MGSLSDYQSFSSGPMFAKLNDISRFVLVANIPKISWTDDKVANRVIDRLYDHLRDVVKAAGFYYDDELTPFRRGNGIGIEYADDIFAFNIRCNDSEIVIERRGSRLSRFHDWYLALMPSSQGLITTFATIVAEEQQRKIEVLRAQYKYEFVLSELVAENTGKRVKNAEIMRKLLKGYPDDNGLLTDHAALLDTIGRTDFHATRWIGEEGRRRLMRFSVEAPANSAWSTLWCFFGFAGESYTSPDGATREAFVPDSFLSEYERAYAQFFRDCAVNGFMEWLLAGFQFKTTIGHAT
jgi:hypothetical protein